MTKSITLDGLARVMSGSYPEEIRGAKLREGLWRAILESDVVAADDVDSIRFQKLLLCGIDHFDLDDDVTTEWYLDGDTVHMDAADFERAGSSTELDSAHRFHLEEYPTVEQITEFYESELDESYADEIEDETFEFLRSYYEEHEDIPYRELYLRNLDVHQSLSEAMDELRTSGEIDAEAISEFEKRCRDLKTELLMYEEFENAVPYVDAFEAGGTALLEQVRGDGLEEPSEAVTVLDEYDQFYYYGFWQIVAWIISYHNHGGPSGPDLRDERRRQIRGADEAFRSRYEGLAKWMGQHGITLPSLPADLPEVSAEVDLDGERDEIDTGSAEPLEYGNIAATADLADEPAEIDLDELMEEDEEASPLSELIVEEREEL